MDRVSGAASAVPGMFGFDFRVHVPWRLGPMTGS